MSYEYAVCQYKLFYISNLAHQIKGESWPAHQRCTVPTVHFKKHLSSIIVRRGFCISVPGHLTLDSPSPRESVPAPLMRGLYKGLADDGSIHWSLFPSPTSRTSLALYHTHLGMMVFKSVLLYNSIDIYIYFKSTIPWDLCPLGTLWAAVSYKY